MICPHCECESDTVERRRQNTSYVDDDELNYITCCLECFERVQEYWADMWDMYWKDVM